MSFILSYSLHRMWEKPQGGLWPSTMILLHSCEACSRESKGQELLAWGSLLSLGADGTRSGLQ